MAPGDRVFRAAPGLRLRSWGDESDVVFLPATRNTHLINRTAGAVLQAVLATGSADLLGLHGLLADPQGQANAPESAEQEWQILTDCVQGLLEAGFLC